MQIASFKYYWEVAQRDPPSGVKVYPMTEYLDDDRSDDSGTWYRSLMPDDRTLPKAERPDGVTFGIKYLTVAMNPVFLLPWWKRQSLAKGVGFVRAEVKFFDEARDLAKAKIIVNASGVGAKTLAGDILMRVNRITNGAFGGLDLKGRVEDIVGFMPGTEGRLRVARKGDVVHAYEVEGAGYIYYFGIEGGMCKARLL